MKDYFELYAQFEEFGYVTHYCIECGEESNSTEPDADKAYCEGCQKLIDVTPLV